MRWAFLSLYGYVLSVPPAFLCVGLVCRSRSQYRPSRAIFADSIVPLRAVALAEGYLPWSWVTSEPMGFAVAPPLSPYTGLVSLRDFAVRRLELRSVFHTFPARRSTCIHGDKFGQFH